MQPPDIRDTLFGDLPLDSWAAQGPGVEPWLSFASARDDLARGNGQGAVATLCMIAQMQGLESRHYAQAWHLLRGLGVQPPPHLQKELLGVVVEVAMDGGVDLLAAYADRSARYYNFSGSGVVWERPNPSLDPLIDALLDAGRAIVVHIGPWEGPRRPPPTAGQVRLNMLTPGGLCFGEGPFEALSGDPMGGRLIHAATELMQGLTVLGAPPGPARPE
jgi:hypothetical protein